MMNSVKKAMFALGLAAVAALSACGGGGENAGTPPFGNDPGTNPNDPVAADLVVAVDKVSIVNNGLDTAELTVTAVDANRQTVANVPVSVQVNNDAIVSSTSTVSDTNGKYFADIGAGNNKANRVITVTALSGKISKTITLTVTGAKLTSTAAASFEPGAAGEVIFSLKDVNSNAITGQPIVIVAAGVLPAAAEGATNGSGEYTFKFNVPASATGALKITASAGGITVDQLIQVKGTVATPDVTENILSASVSSNPSVVGINSTAEGNNRAELRALFLGADNKPIPNVRVKFDLAGDANSVGGTFQTSDPVLSNANGVATTSYRPGTRSSPLQGVTVRACYAKTDAGLAGCPQSATTTLTVSSEPLGVTIGTNNLINVQTLTYTKQFVVTVVDASGQPMAGVDVTAVVKLEQYRKGAYDFLAADPPLPAGWRPVNPLTCPKEDKNDNGVLEAGDDDDGDGRLEPRPSDVAVRMLQSKTGSDGTAQLEIQYAQNFATWVNARITVSATGIGGTEGRDSMLVVPLPAPNTVFLDQNVTPAFARSPYGVVSGASGCSNPF